MSKIEQILKALSEKTAFAVCVTTSSENKIRRSKNVFGWTDVLIRSVKNEDTPIHALSINVEYAPGEWIDVLHYLQKKLLEEVSLDQKEEK